MQIATNQDAREWLQKAGDSVVKTALQVNSTGNWLGNFLGGSDVRAQAMSLLQELQNDIANLYNATPDDNEPFDSSKQNLLNVLYDQAGSDAQFLTSQGIVSTLYVDPIDFSEGIAKKAVDLASDAISRAGDTVKKAASSLGIPTWAIVGIIVVVLFLPLGISLVRKK